MSTTEPTPAVAAARRVSEIAVAWTVTASTFAIVLGVLDASVALLAFGAVGYVDAAGSIALVHHFRHAQRHAELEDRFERRAHMVVAFGLLSVGTAAIVVGIVKLGYEPDSSVAAVVLAAVSLVVLSALAMRKVWVGRRVPSPALVADGHLSMVGALQASVTLVGVLVPSIDAIAAMIVGAIAVGLGIKARRDLGPSAP
jgi:divalent metal cation (Fe/Co/Zn/Cd) transporter